VLLALARSKYLVRTSYLQIYNEVISDLLKPDKTGLTIREDRRRGVYVEGLSEWVVRSPEEVHQLIQQGSFEVAASVLPCCHQLTMRAAELACHLHRVLVVCQPDSEHACLRGYHEYLAP
jgi:hypothetical protein